MAKIMHTADLHLQAGEDKKYCFTVLDDLIVMALAEKADILIIAGDLFDSFADFEALRKEVVEKFAPLAVAGCEIVYIPGNHDAKGSAPDLGRFNLEPIKFCTVRPFTLLTLKGVELLCVPHAASYDDYRDWVVQPKREAVPRIAVVHALNSTIYAGPDPEAEAKAGVLPDDFFVRFGIDYGAMGHIHAGRCCKLGGAVVCYPGSPRVWRAHPREAGVKTALVIDTSALPVTPAQSPVANAGCYRQYCLPLALDGTVAGPALDKIAAEVEVPDLVRVELSGVVEDENAVKATEAAIYARLKDICRKAEVKTDTMVVAELSDNALVKAFLAEIEAARPAPEAPSYRAWLLARQYGLAAIAARLGGAV